MSSSNGTFCNLRIAALESRRSEEMVRLIKKHQGQPSVSPSMSESPIVDNRKAVEFANRVLTGEIDAVIFMTGVGAKYLVEHVEKHVDRQRFIDALTDLTTISRGAKPTVALKKLGITPTFRAAEPNTWREILNLIDQDYRVTNLKVAIQEYGVSNPSLVAGLEARGATAIPVPVYHWDLPEDTRPLEENVRKLVDNKIDILLITSAIQMVHMLKIAEGIDLAEDLIAAMHRQVVIASIGPTTSEMLKELGLPVDFEPTRSTMGNFVNEVAQNASKLMQLKHQSELRLFEPEDEDDAADEEV